MNILSFEKVFGTPEFDGRTWKLTYESSTDGLKDWAFIEKGNRNLWVIYLHGHGATGEQLYTRRDVIENYLLSIRQKELGIIAPNLRNNSWMSPATVHDLHEILAFVKQHYNTAGFIILSSSMGGTGALIYALRHPEDIFGVAAGCPATDLLRYYNWCISRTSPDVLKEIAQAIKTSYNEKASGNSNIYIEHSACAKHERLTMPVYLSHGSSDAIIPVDESRFLAEKLSFKKDFFYHEIDGGDHDAPLKYAARNLEWILANMKIGL